MKRSELGFTMMRVPLDFFALVAAGTAAYYLRFHPIFTELRPVIFNLTLEKYFAFLVPIAILWIGVFAISGLYIIRLRSIMNELTRIAIACSASMTVVFAISFFSRVLFESRFIALAAWILAIVFVSLARLSIRGLQRSLLYWGIGVHRAVIIGKGNASQVLQD